MTTAPFRQVKASAGSGKTFALTRRFLELLTDADPDNGSFACAGAPERPFGYSWPEILAVTFTNKAAAEMKERVLLALKRRALDLPDAADENMSPARAEALLTDILRHAQHLGSRTIDSLLNLLVRLFSLDLGMRPDFETVFDEGPAMQKLLERFLARCEQGGANGDKGGEEAEALYAQAVRTLIEHENRDGFWLQDTLRQRLTGRGTDSAEVIAQRMERARAEISHWDGYDYVVVNDDIDVCFGKVSEILAAERMRRTRQTGLIDFVRDLMGSEG